MIGQLARTEGLTVSVEGEEKCPCQPPCDPSRGTVLAERRLEARHCNVHDNTWDSRYVCTSGTTLEGCLVWVPRLVYERGARRKEGTCMVLCTFQRCDVLLLFPTVGGAGLAIVGKTLRQVRGTECSVRIAEKPTARNREGAPGVWTRGAGPAGASDIKCALNAALG